MVCNGVKYYPEKDADSYYARPRSESFNPMTSLSLSLSLSLFVSPHLSENADLSFPLPICYARYSKGEELSWEGSKKKGYLLLAISFFVLLPRDKPRFFLSFFFPQSLPLLIYIDVALARDHKLHNRGAIWIYKFATGMIIRDDRTEGWESVSFFYIL